MDRLAKTATNCDEIARFWLPNGGCVASVLLLKKNPLSGNRGDVHRRAPELREDLHEIDAPASRDAACELSLTSGLRRV